MICIFPNTCIYTRLFCSEHTPCLEKSKVMKKNFLIQKYNLQNLDVCAYVRIYVHVCKITSKMYKSCWWCHVVSAIDRGYIVKMFSHQHEFCRKYINLRCNEIKCRFRYFFNGNERSFFCLFQFCIQCKTCIKFISW